MLRLRALALAAAPLALAAARCRPPLGAQAAPAGLAQVQAHLRAVNTMTAQLHPDRPARPQPLAAR